MKDYGIFVILSLVCLIWGFIIGLNCGMNLVKNDYYSKLCSYKGGKYIMNNICVAEDNYIDLND